MLEEFREIDLEVINLLLAGVPDDWTSIRIDLAHEEKPDGTHVFPMTISDAEGKPSKYFPSESLYAPVTRNFQLAAQAGQPWKGITYVARFDEASDKWRFSIDYRYE